MQVLAFNLPACSGVTGNPEVIHLAEKCAFRRKCRTVGFYGHELLIIGELGATAPIQDSDSATKFFEESKYLILLPLAPF